MTKINRFLRLLIIFTLAVSVFAGCNSEQTCPTCVDPVDPVDPSSTSWDVTLDDSKGGESHVRVKKGGLLPDSPTFRPEYAGSFFMGWYFEPGGTTPVPFPYLVSNDITLYAKWFELPAELATISAKPAVMSTMVWFGYDEYAALKSNDPWWYGSSTSPGMMAAEVAELSGMGKDLVIVGLRWFSTSDTVEVPAAISDYGGAAVTPTTLKSNTWASISSTSAPRLYVLLSNMPEPVLTGTKIGAPVEGVFAARNAINLEVGASVNLTALMEVDGFLSRGFREATWDFSQASGLELDTTNPSLSGSVPNLSAGTVPVPSLRRVTASGAGNFPVKVTTSYGGAEFNATITVNVATPAPFAKTPDIDVIDGGVQAAKDRPTPGRDPDGRNPARPTPVTATPPPDAPIYLGFTSDAHNGTNNNSGKARSVFNLWMDDLQELLIANNTNQKLEYMSFLGDNGSAFQTGTGEPYWRSVEELMGWADAYKAPRIVGSGENETTIPTFVERENIFIFGNHEWYTSAGGDYRNHRNDPAAERLTPANTDIVTEPGYILYPFGVIEHPDPSAGSGAPQIFEIPAIETLDANLGLLASENPTKPIFVLSHFPIHTNGTRTSENAAQLIKVLNEYPNVIFLWGHNHSEADKAYDKVFGPGFEAVGRERLTIGSGVLGETPRINFHYAGAGCMSDREYNGNADQIDGKGLLAAINGPDITFTWYDKPDLPPIPKPTFQIPEEILALSLERVPKVWYGAAEYNADFRDWYSGTLGGVVNNFAGLGSEIVIIGVDPVGADRPFPAAALPTIASYGGNPAAITGCGPTHATSGKWCLTNSSSVEYGLVILHTMSDGNIWLPGSFTGNSGEVKLKEVVKPARYNSGLGFSANYGDIVLEADASTDFTWQQVIDALMVAGDTTPVLLNSGNPESTSGTYNADLAYILQIGDNYYWVSVGSARSTSLTPG